MALILDGKKTRDERMERLKTAFSNLSKRPNLTIIKIGENSSQDVYVRQKKLFGESIGVEVKIIDFPSDSKEVEIINTIKIENKDENVNGIIVQLPLPNGMDKLAIIEAIYSEKDVDSLTAVNVKKMYSGNPTFVPATTKGILTLLDRYNIPVLGKRVCVVGRSDLVGKPTAIALINKGATVTVCHSQTVNLSEETKRSDVLIVAVGHPGLINKNHVSPGQVVVDVGLSKVGERLVGDVVWDEVENIVSAITPVPGGVGPMTVISLFENLLIASGGEL